MPGANLMAGPNAGRSGSRWRALVRQVKATENICISCGQRVDWSIPRYLDPDGDPLVENPEFGTIGHKYSRETHPHLAEDRGNLGPEHARCNKQHGSASIYSLPNLGLQSRQW